MILTEHGLHFRQERRNGEQRCVEYPRLVMLRGGLWRVDGAQDQTFNDAASAIAAARAHDMDVDAVCRRCGFDGAEWHHLQHLRPFDERDDAPDCL